MMLKRVAVLVMLVAATVSWAQVVPNNAPKGDEGGPVIAPGGNGLVPRTPMRKLPVVQKPVGESRLMVKFRDDLKIRPTPGADAKVVSRVNADTSSIEAIANKLNVEFVSAFNTVPEERMANLENRAAAWSGKAQTDLGGWMYVEGPQDSLEAAAQALNELQLTEYVYFRLPWRPIGGGANGACCVPLNGGVNCVADVTEDICVTAGGLFQGPGSTCGTPCDQVGACCLTEDECVALTEEQCDGLGGGFKGVGVNCIQDEINCENQECGDPENGSCFETHDNPWCDDEDCCNAVGDLDPGCVAPPEEGGEWDIICVWLAHGICDPGIGADRCLNALAGNCFEFHFGPGCSDAGCCAAVCAIDSFCCEAFWDENCVDLADENCVNPNGDGPTPNFVGNQGYLRASGYEAQFDGLPDNLAPPAPSAPGYGGQGYNLFDESSALEDDPANLVPPGRYLGLYGLGRELHELYGVGNSNGARGKGVKVAVIEWAWYGPEPFTDTNGNGAYNNGEPFIDWNFNGVRDTGHEDLDVITEPGQTMILTPDVTSPDHATACLGIINARPNGFGMTGIAPDAEAYFFPLTSAEEGPREGAAFLNCYDTLGPGDVVSCSFGPFGNLTMDPFALNLIALGTNLGIITCVAAGNDCFKLDDHPLSSGFTELDPPGGGAIVVGACTPGENYCRLPFSNHFEGDDQFVHVSAWGTGVATTGGNPNLWFPGGDWNRSYTNDFNGTSAACPQVAGAVACLSGLAKQMYGIPISPVQMRAVVQTGFLQCGVLNPDNLPGWDDAFGCGPDSDPEEQPNKIGVYVDPRAAGGTVLNQSFAGFDQSPLIEDILVIQGDLVYGTKFSIKAPDGNYLILRSEYVEAKESSGLPGVAGKVKYLANGQTSDIMVIAQSDLKAASNMLVEIVSEPPAGVFAFMIVEMYDWILNDWTFVGFGPPGVYTIDTNNPFVATNANRFLEPGTKKVYLRFYVFGMSEGDLGSDPGQGEFILRHDWVNLTLGGGFGGSVIPPVLDPPPIE